MVKRITIYLSKYFAFHTYKPLPFSSMYKNSFIYHSSSGLALILWPRNEKNKIIIWKKEILHNFLPQMHFQKTLIKAKSVIFTHQMIFFPTLSAIVSISVFKAENSNILVLLEHRLRSKYKENRNGRLHSKNRNNHKMIEHNQKKPSLYRASTRV